MSLSNKIDFAIVFTVKNANPNGDPLNGNRPRVNFDGLGEVSDVCLKRKIRDRLMEAGESIFVQSDHNKLDGLPSLRARAEHEEHGVGKNVLNAKKTSPDEAIKIVCKKWFDVRAFGQVFAFKGGTSIPVRGPISIQSAFSVSAVDVTSTQITKSVSGEGDGEKKSSDTMGMKHRIDDAIYVAYGAMNPQLAERTQFSDEDADVIKSVLPKLFEGDASSARPEGSMAVEKIIWWQHNNKSGQYSSAKVHGLLRSWLEGDASELQGKLSQDQLQTAMSQLQSLHVEVIDGF